MHRTSKLQSYFRRTLNPKKGVNDEPVFFFILVFLKVKIAELGNPVEIGRIYGGGVQEFYE
jgi:hypothetical protein